MASETTNNKTVEANVPKEGKKDGKKRLDTLRVKVNAAKKERDDLNAKLRSKRDSIMGFYNEIDKLLKEARVHKETRDDANKKVSEFKIKRDEANAKIAEMNKALSSMRGVSTGGMNRREYEKTKEEAERLEWKLQTSPVSKAREKVMVRQIETLAIKLADYEESVPVTSEAKNLDKELKTLRTRADQFHKELLGQSDRGEEAHAAMHEIYKKVDGKREKAKKAEEIFLETKREVDLAHEKFVVALNELRAEEDAQGIKRTRERREQIEKLKKDQEEKTDDLMSALKGGGVIKTEDLLFLQDLD